MIFQKLYTFQELPKDVYIKNRKASFDYFFLEEYIAGIQLFGTEVKSIAEGKVTMVDSFCYFEGNDLYIRDLNITERGTFSHEPKRKRKLLLKKKELNKLRRDSVTGTSIIPILIFSSDRGLIKVKIALSKGKKNYDKRNSIKEKELDREISRNI